MNEQEASEERYVEFLDSSEEQITETVYGERVYSVGEKGIIVTNGATVRRFIPWHRVVEVGYHQADTRNFFQGF